MDRYFVYFFFKMLNRDDIIAITEALRHRDTITTADMQRMVSVGYTKAVRILLDLQEMGLVERMKKPGKWKVKRENIHSYLLLNTAN